MSSFKVLYFFLQSLHFFSGCFLYLASFSRALALYAYFFSQSLEQNFLFLSKVLNKYLQLSHTIASQRENLDSLSSISLFINISSGDNSLSFVKGFSSFENLGRFCLGLHLMSQYLCDEETGTNSLSHFLHVALGF